MLKKHFISLEAGDQSAMYQFENRRDSTKTHSMALTIDISLTREKYMKIKMYLFFFSRETNANRLFVSGTGPRRTKNSYKCSYLLGLKRRVMEGQKLVLSSSLHFSSPSCLPNFY